jgi:putative Mg2+ transporter-C (MgtC) family protein
MVAEAATLTVFVVAGNTLLRPVVNAINRIPLVGAGLEATYSVMITTEADQAAQLRDLLVDHLELMRYPVAETEVIARSDDRVEIIATLVATGAADADLDGIVAHLAARHDVEHATWEVQTHD